MIFNLSESVQAELVSCGKLGKQKLKHCKWIYPFFVVQTMTGPIKDAEANLSQMESG
jgi:hypothetical protein